MSTFFPWNTALVMPRVRPGRLDPAIQAFEAQHRLVACDAYDDRAVLSFTWREDEDLRAAVVRVDTRSETLWPWAQALAGQLAQHCAAKVFLVSAGAESSPPDGTKVGHSSTWVGGRGWQAEPSGKGRALELPDAAAAGFSNPVNDDCPTEEFHLLFAACWDRILRRPELVNGVLDESGVGETVTWSAPPLHADPRVNRLARRALWADEARRETGPDGRSGLFMRTGEARELAFPDSGVLQLVLDLVE